MRMSKFLISLLVLFSALTVNASCRPPRGEKIIIGCTYHCDWVYRVRLHFVAWQIGMPIQVRDMRPMGETAMDEVDAVLLPGGADINPEYYLPHVSEELRRYTEENIDLALIDGESDYRDPYEYEIVTKYSQDSKYERLPMLGICRGMQMMTVGQGIPLYLDIATELGIPNRYNVFDRLELEEGETLMRSFYGERKMKGYEMHHQGLRVPYYEENRHSWPNVRVTAYSHDGKIAEVIEYLHRPALGVQFHPEKSWNRTTYPIFKWLFNKACEYKISKEQ